jgi:hypothetical protein
MTDPVFTARILGLDTAGHLALLQAQHREIARLEGALAFSRSERERVGGLLAQARAALARTCSERHEKPVPAVAIPQMAPDSHPADSAASDVEIPT